MGLSKICSPTLAQKTNNVWDEKVIMPTGKAAGAWQWKERDDFASEKG